MNKKIIASVLLMAACKSTATKLPSEEASSVALASSAKQAETQEIKKIRGFDCVQGKPHEVETKTEKSIETKCDKNDCFEVQRQQIFKHMTCVAPKRQLEKLRR